jgi:uncharacterized protein YndB with AHSA1/START domain
LTTVQIRPAPVRKAVTVKAAPARAFEVFTAGMSRWWHPDHHLGKAALKDVVLEPRVGGRWYEIGADGGECDWGHVIAWEPPVRVVLAWQLDGDWRFDPDFITEVEVRFIPEGSGTRVELEHRALERYGEKTDGVRASLDSKDGWEGGLILFAAEADRSG